MAKRQVGQPTSSVDEAATKGSVAAQIAAATKYMRAVVVLEASQTSADVPADFPSGGLIFQKTS